MKLMFCSSLFIITSSLSRSVLITQGLSVSFCILFLSLFQVNGQNVVKVGHRQVVNMIRQGGNSLMVKVVMVTRNPDMEEGARKKSKRNKFTLQRQQWSITWWSSSLSLSIQSHIRVKGWAHRLSLCAPNPWHQNWKRWVRCGKWKDRRMGEKLVQCFPTFFDPYSPLTTAQLPLNQHKPETFHFD